MPIHRLVIDLLNNLSRVVDLPKLVAKCRSDKGKAQYTFDFINLRNYFVKPHKQK